MITAVKALQQSLDNVKAIPELKEKMLEMERAGIDVTIIPAPEGFSKSATEIKNEKHYILYILSKEDDLLAQRKWGVMGTKEENSIAHELGHVYFYYLTLIQNQPIPPCPPKMSAKECEDTHGEKMARMFDNLSRPSGIVIPLNDVQCTPQFNRPEPIMCR